MSVTPLKRLKKDQNKARMSASRLDWVSRRRSPELPGPLTPVEPELLRSRLVLSGPGVLRRDPDTLVFKPHTFTQQRKHNAHKPMRQNLLPPLKQNENINLQVNSDRIKRQRLLSAGRTESPNAGSSSSSLRLPHIPGRLRERQAELPPTGHAVTQSHTLSPAVADSLCFSSVEDVIRAGIRSPYEIVQIIRSNPELGFFYMIPAESKSSYDLKLVPYAALNKTNYYTISSHGVTHYSKDIVDFVPLDRWEQEYLLYQQLLRIPTFALFRQRKAFRRWRSSVRYKTVSLCKRSLDNSLFFMNESLRPALISIREMCYRIQDVHLCRVEKQRTYTLEEFQCAQYAQLKEVSQRLGEFRELVKEVAVTACYTALLEKGFTPDHGKDGDENKTCADLEMLYEETPDKTSYSEQFNKKQECGRLTCFIRLADYLIMSTLHKLTVNSISKLLSELQEHLTHTPSHTLIQSWASVIPTEDTGDKDSVSEQSAEATVLPLFITELMMDTHTLSFQPSIKDFQEVISDVVSRVQETVLSLDPLVLDFDFDAFTQPVINNKIERERERTRERERERERQREKGRCSSTSPEPFS